jgi:3-isopropylmalate dehydrogenase
MMVEHLGFGEEAKRIEAAVVAAVQAGDCTRDLGGGLSTGEAGDAVAKRLGD